MDLCDGRSGVALCLWLRRLVAGSAAPCVNFADFCHRFLDVLFALPRFDAA